MAVGAGKQRALLALLLLHGNDVVSVDRLIEGLWDEPPPSARKAIQVYVSRLRKALGASRIRTAGRGYLLEVGPDELDLSRFERLVAEGRELRREDPARASATLREALALWHGSPLVDLTDEPFADAEIARLEGLRVGAVEERLEADLALGLGAELVTELETLVAQHPYRERLRGQLMLALYRAGRQADALATYQKTRELFVEELGIEPSPALQRLEGAILRHESNLDALLEEVDEEPSAERAGTDESARTTRGARWLRGFRRPRMGVALIGLLLAAGVAAVAVTRAAKPHYLHGLEANAVGSIDPTGVGIDWKDVTGVRSNAIASDGKTIWITDAEGKAITRIGPDRRPVLAQVGVSADGIAYGHGSLWVTNALKRELVQLDPHSFSVVQRIRVGNGPHAVVVGEGAVWVANTIDGTVSRIDLDTGVPGDPIPVEPSPAGIAVGAGGVWVVSEGTGTVFHIDPKSSQVIGRINVGNGASGIAYGENAVWVANRDDGTVTRIDHATDAVKDTIPVGSDPEAIAAGGGSVWVANSGDATVSRIDPEAGRVDRTLRLGSNANGLALANGKLWATTVSAGGHRGGVLRVEAEPSQCPHVDPIEWPGECVIPPLVYDGLVAYRRLGGVAGETLVPNLALRIPAPTNEGRTYVFQLRPGLRYSNGAKMAASDFRHSIERLMRLHDEPGLLEGIVGARGCSKKECDLSRGIRVDDRARTITIRLRAADPDFLHKLALPTASIVPADTPIRYSAKPIPSIGPYRVSSIDPGREIRLVRNEYFRQWAPNARPDGYPNEIRIHLRKSGKARLVAVEEGAADWVDLSHGIPAEQMKGLLIRYPQRLRNSLASESDWFFLNTRVRPFDDVRARRAVNFAIDRRRLVELSGKLGPPSCQVLPPNLPEYDPYCPYTRHRTRAETWTAPDLARARALVRASRTAGTPVVVDTTSRRSSVSGYLASVLRKIGYRATVHTIDEDAYYSFVGDSRNRAQIGWAGWVPDYLAASNFLRALFTCKAFVPKSTANYFNLFEFCDPALDAKMAHAAAVQGSDPERASELWSAVDRALVNQAVAVPWTTPRQRVLLSNRVGNYQGHPLWGTLLDQLWVQ